MWVQVIAGIRAAITREQTNCHQKMSEGQVLAYLFMFFGPRNLQAGKTPNPPGCQSTG